MDWRKSRSRSADDCGGGRLNKCSSPRPGAPGRGTFSTSFRPDVASDEVEAQQDYQGNHKDDHRLGHPADQGGQQQGACRIGGVELVSRGHDKCLISPAQHYAGRPGRGRNDPAAGGHFSEVALRAAAKPNKLPSAAPITGPQRPEAAPAMTPASAEAANRPGARIVRPTRVTSGAPSQRDNRPVAPRADAKIRRTTALTWTRRERCGRLTMDASESVETDACGADRAASSRVAASTASRTALPTAAVTAAVTD